MTRSDEAGAAGSPAGAELDQLSRQVFALSPLPMWVYDRATLRILDVNEAAVERYGYSRDEFLALTLSDLRPAEDVPRLLDAASESQPTPTSRGIFRHRTRAGELFEVEVFSHDADVAGRPAGIVIAQDVTARRRAEAATQEAMHVAEVTRRQAEAAEARVAFLADASARLAGSLDVEATLRTIADLAVPLLADWCFVEVLERGRVRTAAVAHTNPAMIDLAYQVLRRFPIDLKAPYGTGKVLRTGEPEINHEIAEEFIVAIAQDEEHLRILQEVGFRSSISVPLRGSDGRPVAVLSLVSAESGRRFDQGDLGLALEIARRASAALASAQLYAAGQSALRRALALQQVSSALAGALTIDQVADVVVRHGREAVGAAAGAVAVLRPDRTFEVVAIRGYSDDITRAYQRFPVMAGRPLSDAVLARTPQYLSSIAETEAVYPERAPVMRQTGYEAYAALPVIVGPTPVAALGFSFSAARDFDAEDRAFLETLAAQTSQAFARAQLMAAERAARAEAEAANRAKSEFLATMSHELRTPLNAIGGYVDLMMMGIRGVVTHDQRVDLERIRRSQLHLTALINEVLNYARLESGKVQFDLRPLELGEVLTSAIQLVEPQRRAKDIALEVTTVPAGTEPLRVLADAEKVHQVVLNLLSNAVKFTDAGGRVRIQVEPASRHFAVIRVADTGIGIPADKLEEIFEPFVQVGRSLNNPGEGTGLGLAISRDLARGMRGELTVESRVGEGSVFSLMLPRA